MVSKMSKGKLIDNAVVTLVVIENCMQRHVCILISWYGRTRSLTVDITYLVLQNILFEYTYLCMFQLPRWLSWNVPRYILRHTKRSTQDVLSQTQYTRDSSDSFLLWYTASFNSCRSSGKRWSLMKVLINGPRSANSPVDLSRHTLFYFPRQMGCRFKSIDVSINARSICLFNSFT